MTRARARVHPFSCPLLPPTAYSPVETVSVGASYSSPAVVLESEELITAGAQAQTEAQAEAQTEGAGGGIFKTGTIAGNIVFVDRGKCAHQVDTR